MTPDQPLSDTETPATPATPSLLDAWKQSDVHEITLPSGMKVTIRPLDLEIHMLLGDTPGGLRQTALQGLQQRIESGQASDEEKSEAAQLAADYQRGLIAAMVVTPKITLDDLALLPERDVQMLNEIATRRRDTDAAGKPIGVVPLEGSPVWNAS